jgi:hypothetical protein
MPSSDGAGASPGAGGRFETTQWSLVLAAGQRGSEVGEQGAARLVVEDSRI